MSSLRSFRHHTALALSSRKGGGNNNQRERVARSLLASLPAFVFGMAAMYLLSLPFYLQSSSKQHHPHTPAKTPAAAAVVPTTTAPPLWITQPRATKNNDKCDPLLLCAWSLDHPRTQAVSLALWHQTAAADNDNKQQLPTVDESIAAATAGQPQFVQAQYDALDALYEKADAPFLQRTGLVHLDLTNEVHVIPMGGEGEENRVAYKLMKCRISFF